MVFQKASSFGATISKSGLLNFGRWGRYKVPLSPTPPTWYRKNALMYGKYGDIYTNLPSSRECNIFDKELWSVILDKKVRLKVSESALREIDRKGGLDEYIMHTDDTDLGGKGSVGVVLKELLRKRIHEIFGHKELETFEIPKPKLEWRKALDHDFWDNIKQK